MRIKLNQKQAKALLTFYKRSKSDYGLDLYGQVMGVTVGGTETFVEATNGTVLLRLWIDHDEDNPVGKWLVDAGDVKSLGKGEDEYKDIPLMEDLHKAWPDTDKALHSEEPVDESAPVGVLISTLKRILRGLTYIAPKDGQGFEWYSKDKYTAIKLTGEYQDENKNWKRYLAAFMPTRLD